MGFGFYAAHPFEASGYGAALVQLRLRCTPAEWTDAVCYEAREACGYPHDWNDTATQAIWVHTHARPLARAMLERGVQAVIGDDGLLTRELVIYDSRVIEVVDVRETRQPWHV